jgi:ABC-type multidrug transport system fused ATPase/permease subunit
MGTLFTFPLWYLIIFLILLVWVKWWIALIYVVSLPFSLVLYLRGKIMWIKLYNRLRRFHFVFTGNRIFRESVELRKEIVEMLKETVK